MKKELQKNKILLALLGSLSLAVSSCGQEKEEGLMPSQDVSIEKDIDLDIRNENNILEKQEKIQKEKVMPKKELEKPIKKEITISAVGDCTLGRDDNYDYVNSLPDVLKQNEHDYSYFFRGVKDVLESDDLTIANLEGTFTPYEQKRDKKFTFKGDLDYPNILLAGSVEAVNLANNHTYDYGERGYLDTLKALD